MTAVSGWAKLADRALAPLFVPGSPPPSRAQLVAAYPFGERRYHPYRVWLARVRAWRIAHASGRAHAAMTRARPVTADTQPGLGL